VSFYVVSPGKRRKPATLCADSRARQRKSGCELRRSMGKRRKAGRRKSEIKGQRSNPKTEIRNPKEIRRARRIFEQQRRQDTKLFTRISREGFRRPYVTLGAGVAAARPLPPCPARIRATEGSTRESCQYSSHQASTRTTRYKVARPPSRARAWLFGAAPDGTAGMKQKIPGTTSSIGEFRKRGQSIERIRLKDLCGQKATIKNTTKSVQPLNKNLL